MQCVLGWQRNNVDHKNVKSFSSSSPLFITQFTTCSFHHHGYWSQSLQFCSSNSLEFHPTQYQAITIHWLLQTSSQNSFIYPPRLVHFPTQRHQRLRLEHAWICALYKFYNNNNNGVTDLCFCSPQTDTSLCCDTTHAGLVCHVMYTPVFPATQCAMPWRDCQAD